MDAAELSRRAGGVAWFHCIDLGGGFVTPGVDADPARLAGLQLPDLSGRSVLDVGAWDGFYSFEAERRGAARVVACDHWAWSEGGGFGTARAGFDLAREALGSGVEPVDCDVLDIAPETVGGPFDVVLFLGVLYHLRHPLLALERIAAVTADLLVLETEVDLAFLRRPAMAFYPGLELNTDPTNWWGPNPPAVVAMLRDVGFDRVEIVSPNSAGFRAARGLKRLLGGSRSLAAAQRGRLVVHARKT